MMKQEKPKDEIRDQQEQEHVADQEQEMQDQHDSRNKSGKAHGKHDRQVDDLKKKLAETEMKLSETQDKYLRLAAEFDNYRKRTLKERMDLIKSSGEEIILKVIPVLDDFDRGIKIIDISRDIDPVKEGIHLIYNKFKEILSQMGVKEIEALNTGFNTDLHDAVTKIPAPDESSKGKVLDVVQKGYLLNDKVIRFAKVIVGE